jgi:hypothetical protein
MSVSKRSGTDTVEEITKKRIEKRNGEKRIMKNEKTTNTKTNTVNNDDFKIIGKKFKFCINNDTNTELTEQACLAFIKWLSTPQNSNKYTNCHGIIAGGWCINLSDVTEMYHIGSAYDALTGGTVEMIYLKFDNRLLNRIVYLDSEIINRGSILLPIDGKIEYIPFSFKYMNGTRKRKTPTKTDTTATTEKTPTKKSTTTKTNTKTNSTTTPTKTKTPTKTTKTTAER